MQGTTRGPAVLLAAAALLAATPAGAQSPGGACAYKPIDVARYGNKPFQNPPELRSRNGRLETVLRVEYTNPATTSLGGCPITLRSYNGQLVGPTFRVRPGDVLAPLLVGLVVLAFLPRLRASTAAVLCLSILLVGLVAWANLDHPGRSNYYFLWYGYAAAGALGGAAIYCLLRNRRERWARVPRWALAGTAVLLVLAIVIPTGFIPAVAASL